MPAVVLENVPRIAAPAPAVLLRDFLLPARPVILTGLFDGAPLSVVRTLQVARRELSDVELEIQPNYLVFLETGSRGTPRRMRFSEYLDQVEREPRTRDQCVEFPTPQALLRRLPAPDYAGLGDVDDWVSSTFVANAGNFNHLHYDDDQRNVLLYEVFGTKRFSLISPDQAPKLDAYLTFDTEIRRALARVPARDANGRAYLQTFPDEPSREAFLSYLGASDCLLHPGETLFMPALWWHYVEYRDTSLSITYRLGRNRYNRGLAELFPAPDLILQRVGARLIDAERFGREHPALLAELRAVLDADYASHALRAEAVRAFVGRAFESVFGESPTAVLAARELHRAALAST
jgi:lysine-specific demethylase 8